MLMQYTRTPSSSSALWALAQKGLEPGFFGPGFALFPLLRSGNGHPHDEAAVCLVHTALESTNGQYFSGHRAWLRAGFDPSGSSPSPSRPPYHSRPNQRPPSARWGLLFSLGLWGPSCRSMDTRTPPWGSQAAPHSGGGGAGRAEGRWEPWGNPPSPRARGKTRFITRLPAPDQPWLL